MWNYENKNLHFNIFLYVCHPDPLMPQITTTKSSPWLSSAPSLGSIMNTFTTMLYLSCLYFLDKVSSVGFHRDWPVVAFGSASGCVHLFSIGWRQAGYSPENSKNWTELQICLEVILGIKILVLTPLYFYWIDIHLIKCKTAKFIRNVKEIGHTLVLQIYPI